MKTEINIIKIFKIIEKNSLVDYRNIKMDLNEGTQFPVMYKNNLCFIESKILKFISKINF